MVYMYITYTLFMYKMRSICKINHLQSSNLIGPFVKTVVQIYVYTYTYNTLAFIHYTKINTYTYTRPPATHTYVHHITDRKMDQ